MGPLSLTAQNLTQILLKFHGDSHSNHIQLHYKYPSVFSVRGEKFNYVVGSYVKHKYIR
jgi:hypothetical protein